MKGVETGGENGGGVGGDCSARTFFCLPFLCFGFLFLGLALSRLRIVNRAIRRRRTASSRFIPASSRSRNHDAAEGGRREVEIGTSHVSPAATYYFTTISSHLPRPRTRPRMAKPSGGVPLRGREAIRRRFGSRPARGLERGVGTLWVIEEDFQRAKVIGLNQYEAWRWEGWHRHIAFCLLAHAFLALTRAVALGEKGDRSPH